MITPKQIKMTAMTSEKQDIEQNDFFAVYFCRPISYIMTIPFLYLNITPNAISIISVFPNIAGFIILGLASNKTMLIIGWACFFLWSMLDFIDGNVARYKKQFTALGGVYDAMSGYVSMFLSFFAFGWAAAHQSGILCNLIHLPNEIYIILGGLSGAFVLFPRLMMHKVASTLGNSDRALHLSNKTKYGVVQTFALNFISIGGFIEIIMLIAIIFNFLDVFTIVYFALNLAVMLVSLKNILCQH